MVGTGLFNSDDGCPAHCHFMNPASQDPACPPECLYDVPFYIGVLLKAGLEAGATLGIGYEMTRCDTAGYDCLACYEYESDCNPDAGEGDKSCCPYALHDGYHDTPIELSCVQGYDLRDDFPFLTDNGGIWDEPRPDKEKFYCAKQEDLKN